MQSSTGPGQTGPVFLFDAGWHGMTHHTMTDQELMDELNIRFARSRKAFYDLTVTNQKLRLLNQKLEDAERLKSNFLSNIRNELNDPLNTLLVISKRIMALSGQSAELFPLADMIHNEACNLEFQLHNIIMAAELEAGDAHPTPARISLATLLQELLRYFQPLAKHQQLHLEGTVTPLADGTTPQLTCDPEKVFLILTNLVSNAIKFSVQGGTVSITLALENHALQVQVHDTGIGIREEDIARIFDRFLQLDHGSTRPYPGLGLGLSVAKSLVELLQGQLQISSVPQQGTAVSVWLPGLQAVEGETPLAEDSNLFWFDATTER